MSEENELQYNTVDAVNLAAAGDVNGFKSAINDLLMDKVKDAVDVKRFDVQQNFMPSEAAPETEE